MLESLEIMGATNRDLIFTDGDNVYIITKGAITDSTDQFGIKINRLKECTALFRKNDKDILDSVMKIILSNLKSEYNRGYPRD